jgi:ribosomal protein S18 acetylase RimI-like enzyme
MTDLPSVSVSVLPPSQIAASERASFKQMILEGGEVNPKTLSGLIDRALALAFIWVDGALVGVGAIKRPYKSHRHDVFQYAKVEYDPMQFEFELGWVYVNKASRNRRLASRLVEALMPSLNGARVYATSRVDNARMHESLQRFGFKQVGTPYPSKQSEPEIQLFVCT